MIRFENVTKKFGPKTVLDGIDLQIDKGEVFCIVGTSGAGKSVTLKHMVRLLTPDDGQVWIEDDVISGVESSDLERIRKRFGYLFQGAALLQWLDVEANVGLPLREKTQMSEEEIHAKVLQTLEMLDLGDALSKHPTDLSGGMQKRVGLARAIIMEPDIILYDEPTSGLDPVTSRNIDQLILRMQKDLGITSVVVTHDLHSALGIGTRIAMLDEGKIVELAEPEAFIRSEHPKVRRFLDSQYITKRAGWEDAS